MNLVYVDHEVTRSRHRLDGQNKKCNHIFSYLKAKINTYRQEHHVVDIVHTFRDLLFHPDNQPRLVVECDKIKIFLCLPQNLDGYTMQ